MGICPNFRCGNRVNEKRALGGLDIVIGIFVLLFGDQLTMVISRFRSLSILDTRNLPSHAERVDNIV